MKKISILLFFVFSSFVLWAQHTVTGTVTDQDGQTLPGVVVVEKGTNNGTITDLDGKYSLQLTSGDATLIISHLGYKKIEIPVANQNEINVTLEADETALDEIVVVGYGTQKKSDLTGAIASVNMDDFEKRQVSTVDQALQGQVAGLDVTVNSGSPGGGIMVRIRGIGTLNNSDPLFVVDGMMVDDIDFLNPNDIKDIQVLKDASATAIYGSRGANGVVIVTTKNGIDKGAKISFNSYYGVQNFWRKPPLCNSEQWAILNNEAKNAAGIEPFPSLSDPKTLPSTDWFDQITNKNAGISNYDLSVSGGTSKSSYYVSASYMKQEGIVKKSDFERMSLRVNSTHKAKKWFTVGENITLVKTKQHSIYEEDEWTNILISALNMDPVTSVYNEDGTFAPGIYNDINNPVADIYYTNDEDNAYRALGNVYAEITALKFLKFKSNLSLEYTYGVNDNFDPVYYVSPTQQNGTSMLGKDADEQLMYQWSNTLTFDKSFGNHHITALAGTEIYSFHVSYYGISVSNLPSNDPDIRFISNANGRNAANVYGSIYDVRQMSGLARLNYSFQDKYLFTANFRADASSKFSKKHRWGYFPSFSLGWKISEEDFLKSVSAINNLKLRVGWGQIGNQGSVPAYQSVTTATTGQNYVWGNTLAPGIAFMSSGNDEIKWETTTTTNIGIDFGLFNGKLSGTAEYFIKYTSDMLLQVPVPGQTGLQEAPWQNAGEMRNNGIELSLQYKNYEHPFKYSFGGVFTKVNNEVLSLGNGNEFIDGGSFRDNYFVTRTVVGQPIAQFYGYKTDGLFQTWDEVRAQTAQANVAPGDVKYVDADGDGNLDMFFLGSPLPDFTYSFNANFEYRGLDFSMVLQGVYGNKIFNGTAYYNRSSSAYWNLYNDMLNRWTGEGTQNDPRYPRMNATDANNSLMSDRFIEDGSYLRIKTMQIGYTLPKSLLDLANIQTFRIYINAQNLLTFTKYTGLDPEIGQGRQGALDLGIDRAFYPQARLFSFGINLTF